MDLLSGHEVEPLEEAVWKKLKKNWGGFEIGLVRVNPGRWILPTNYKMFADKLYDFKFRKSDVLVMTWPKCGTTWTQEIIWTMTNNPNLNHPLANTFIFARSPYQEFDIFFPTSKDPPPMNDHVGKAFLELCPGKNPNDGLNLQLCEAVPDRRIIKTHLSFSLRSPTLLDSTKVVYVARNPKDVVVSYHHHCRISEGLNYHGTFDEYVQHFLDDELMYGPYWQHMKEAWERKDHPNLHIIFFEDLKANNMEELRKLNTFLNTNLTENQLENIAKYTSFSMMKERGIALDVKDVPVKEFQEEGGFYRKGEVGDWKEKLTPALEAKVDEWIEKNLSSFGINFKYSI